MLDRIFPVLKNHQTAFAWGATGLLVLFLLWIATGSSSYTQCESNQETYYGSYDDPSLFERAYTVVICEGAAIADNGEFITALATIALVFSTILLWIATKETAKIAERTLTDLERPWVHITDVDVDGIFHNPPFLPIEKVNFGRTVATIIGVKGGFKTSAREIDIDSISLSERELDQVRNSLPPNKPYTSTIRFKPYGDESIPMFIQAGDAKFVFRGVLLYQGLSRTSYETWFCFRYDVDRNCLVRHGGEKYNYTK